MGQENWPNLRRIVTGKKPLNPWVGVSGAGPFLLSGAEDLSLKLLELEDEDRESST